MSNITHELWEEHGITAIALRCPCACDANSLTGKPKPDCPYCHGEGKIQYGIDEAEFI